MKKVITIVLFLILLVAPISNASLDTEPERRAALKLFQVGAVDIKSRFTFLRLYITDTDDAQPLPEDDEAEADRLDKRRRYNEANRY